MAQTKQSQNTNKGIFYIWDEPQKHDLVKVKETVIRKPIICLIYAMLDYIIQDNVP